MMACLLWALFTTATRAQDAVYLLGTDGVMEANHASATLYKDKNGNYTGEVTFSSHETEFTIVTRLAETADGWRSIKKYRYSPDNGSIYARVTKEIYSNWKYEENFSFTHARDVYWVKVTLPTSEAGTITIYPSKEDDPDYEADDDDDDDIEEVPDIDLSTGAHFTVNLSQPGTLQQRLTSAVFETDYDLVDFLTVRGKMGGKDIAYLQAQEGLVSQLQYLDLSQVELVYDDEVYYTTSYQKNWGSFGGFVEYQTDIYTLSAENKVEDGQGGFSGAVIDYVTYYRRNNLAMAFKGMKYLKQCKLPKSMEGIGNSILEGCPLNKVTLPTAPTYIWGEAFAGTQLISINLPSTLVFIGDRAFDGVPLSKIDISHVTSLGKNCLAGTNLKSVQLNEQLTEISEGLFSGCKKLTSITIPGNVKTIGDKAFSGGVLASVTIPESVTEIGTEAFSGCSKLQTVTMGNGVRKIGERAFAGCLKLTDMTISANVEEIGNNAFAGQIDEYSEGFIPWVENIATEDGVKYIAKVAYKYISGSTVNIKEGTISVADEFNRRYLGYGEYNYNADITSIILPSTLRFLGDNCFRYTNISSITLPDALERIGSYALNGCSKLRRITIPQNVKYIGQCAFDGTAIVRVNYNAVEADVWEQDNDGVYSQIFPSSVTRVIIGEGVKVIPPALFMGCKNLVRVQMASTVESIGYEAFNTWGSSLQNIDLPSSLKYLGGGSGFESFNTITAYMKEPIELSGRPSEEEVLNDEEVRSYIAQGEAYDGVVFGSTPFGGLYYPYHIDEQGNLTWGEPSNTYPSYQDIEKQDIILRVPNGSLEAYKASPYWANNFKEIVTFDRASDTETITESTAVSVSKSVTEQTDLSGSIVDGIYVTLDTEDSGDGYDATEGCIVINSQTTEEGMEQVTADGADDLTVKNQLNGIVFEIPAGKGKITVDAQTLGSRVLYVKIGNAEPQKVTLSTRGTMTLNYDVAENTRVFIYAANDNAVASTAADSDVIAASIKAPRRAAYANDDSVKLFGLTITVDEKANYISSLPASVTLLKDGKFMQRNRIVIVKNGVQYNAAGQRVK